MRLFSVVVTLHPFLSQPKIILLLPFVLLMYNFRAIGEIEKKQMNRYYKSNAEVTQEYTRKDYKPVLFHHKSYSDNI